MSGHYTEDLTHDIDAHTGCLPVLALDEDLFPIAAQHQVNAAIRSLAAQLLHGEAFSAVGLAHEQFEVLPADRSEPIPSPGIDQQLLAMCTCHVGNATRSQEEHGDSVLATLNERP